VLNILKNIKLMFFALSAFFLFSCCTGKENSEALVKPDAKTEKSQKATSRKYNGFEVIREFPHDVEAYTQGLFYLNGFLYESTGHHGKSSIRKIDFQTGEVLKKKKIGIQYFGEGICHSNGKIYMLTWQSNKGFVFDLETFDKLDNFEYKTEGWGIETLNDELIISDGTHQLHFLNKNTFAETGVLDAKYNNAEVRQLNELELVGEKLYANIYMYDAIAKIDVNSGKVEDIYDFSPLRQELNDIQASEAFNGIAYIPESNTFIVTGKYWDKYFEIKFN
jgi:glutamine cyclotransferase